MVTKHIILSKNDANLLEDTVARYGRIVSSDQLNVIFGKIYSGSKIRGRISLLSKLGWLVRLRRGLYSVVTDIGSLSANDISAYTMCRALNKESYVSFENALQYHGMFDQMLSTVSAVTCNRARKYKIRDIDVRFFKIRKKLYFGFTEERSDIGLVNIAQKEKAILDILYFRSNRHYAGLVWEKLEEYRKNIDFDILKLYAVKFSLDVIRQTGFFLDRLNIETGDLLNALAGKTSYSRMTNESRKFSAKWRLYFDDSVIK